MSSQAKAVRQPFQAFLPDVPRPQVADEGAGHAGGERERQEEPRRDLPGRHHDAGHQEQAVPGEHRQRDAGLFHEDQKADHGNREWAPEALH